MKDKNNTGNLNTLKNTMPNILFGSKDDFGIELGFTKSSQKYKLRFWVKGTKIGTFTKAGEINYSINAYRKFTENKEFYYLPLFEHLTPTRIFYYLTDMSLLLTDSDEDFQEAQKRQKFYLFFGKQFSNDASSLFLLYKDKLITFLYNPPKKEKVENFEVTYNNFCKVFDEYIAYCISIKLM